MESTISFDMARQLLLSFSVILAAGTRCNEERFCRGTIPVRRFWGECGMVVDHDFGVNLNVLMKRLVLGESWGNKRMKAIRFGFIHIVGRVIEHSRRLFERISGNHPSSQLLMVVRRWIVGLAIVSG